MRNLRQPNPIPRPLPRSIREGEFAQCEQVSPMAMGRVDTDRRGDLERVKLAGLTQYYFCDFVAKT